MEMPQFQLMKMEGVDILMNLIQKGNSKSRYYVSANIIKEELVGKVPRQTRYLRNLCLVLRISDHTS